MVRIKEEPEAEPCEFEVRYRTAESEIENNVNYYEAASIRDQVLAAWNGKSEVKPKIEAIEIDPNLQPIIRLDSDFLRNKCHSEWIEVVKATFLRPFMTKACQLCEKLIQFKSATNLIEHYKEEHPKDITTYNCTLCEFSGKQSQEIVDHWTEQHKRHHRSKNKYTEEKKTNDRNNIWIGDDEFVHSFFASKLKSVDKKQIQESTHAIVEYENDNQEIENEQSNESYAKCDICSKNVPKTFLPYHKLIHENKGKKIECHICLKQFLNRDSLHKHEYTIHQIVQPEQFECDYCQKVFQHKNSLEIHMIMHIKYNAFTRETSAKRFKCEYCSEGFPSKPRLKAHKLVHEKKKLQNDHPQIAKQRSQNSYVECDICSKKVTKKHLSYHKLMHKNDRTKFECNVCSKIFFHKSNLTSHMKTHMDKSKRKKFECKICLQQFVQRYALQRHEYAVHKIVQPEQFECGYCGKVFGTKNGLETHMNIHIKYNTFTIESRAKLYKCEHCSKAFSASFELKQHEFRKHIRDTLPEDDPRMIRLKNSYVECDICLKKMQKESMVQHKLIHNDERSKLFVCEICQKSFCNKASLKHHITTHMDMSERKKFECKTCSKQFLNVVRLRWHEKIHSENPLVNKCEFCCKTFEVAGGLRRHIREQHEKAEPFKCEYCMNEFKRKESLESHEFNIHLKGKIPDDDPRTKYKRIPEFVECDICSKTMTKHSLREHKRIVHQRERPFKCDLCNQGCTSKGNLDKHKATHKNEKLFECTFCPIKLNKKSLQITHEMSHRKENLYTCQFCYLKIKDKGSFYIHIRSVHFNLLRQQDRSNGELNDFFQDVRTYECFKCKYPSCSLNNIRKHIEACTIGSTFMKCPKCILKFDRKRVLRTHMTIQHRKINRSRFKKMLKK